MTQHYTTTQLNNAYVHRYQKYENLLYTYAWLVFVFVGAVALCYINTTLHCEMLITHATTSRNTVRVF